MVNPTLNKVDLFIKEGDRNPSLTATLVDEAELPLDLSAAVAVKFFMILPQSSTPKISGAAASIVSAQDGTIEYAWQAGDTDTPGDYDAEFEVEWADGTKTTFPNFRFLKIRILKSIDTAD